MKKSELIKVVAEEYKKYDEQLAEERNKSFSQLSVREQSEIMINLVLDSITKSLIEDGKVSISGFGTFEVRERKEKNCKNPQTKEMITVPGYKAAVFKSGKNLKEAVNK